MPLGLIVKIPADSFGNPESDTKVVCSNILNIYKQVLN